jgi:hypothetical protein
MADPRNELADIVVPVAPAMTGGGGGLSPWVWALALLGAAGVALVIWQWRRRRFVRSLRAIAGAVERQRDTPIDLSSRLDGWARARFQMTRLDAKNGPPGLDANGWSDWVDSLTRLRFAAPSSDGFEGLAALCETARHWKPRA